MSERNDPPLAPVPVIVQALGELSADARRRRSLRNLVLTYWITAVAGVACLGAGVRAEDERNLFEWSGVARVVVTGTSLGEDGRYVEFRVASCLRGDVQPRAIIDIDLREANRSRDRLLDPKALRLETGTAYVLLLERNPDGRYRLMRGVNGARELPLEGREAYLTALQEFIEIQDAGGEELKWHRLAALLQASNPILIQTSLEQFLKFRRGEPDLLLTLVPLLDHPQSPVRADAAQLIGQIVERRREGVDPEDDETVRAELIARATRDEAVPVRVAATEALAAYPLAIVDQVLEDIAESDPEQLVRYAAQRARLERHHEADP